MFRSVVRFAMKVRPVPALEDNYMYLVYDETRKEGFAVDPVEPEKIKDAADELNLTLKAALVTHHHWDHAGGTPRFHEMYPDLQIVAGDDRVQHASHLAKHNETFDLGGMKITCLSTPCHTSGHVCYFVQDEGGTSPTVFTGDTLFIAGCGKFFEGTADQMQKNLNEILSCLPDETHVFPGHEYTAANLRFAHHIEKDNNEVSTKLKWAQECGKSNQPTVPSTIGEEKKTNPFMRVHVPAIQSAVGFENPVTVMNALRDAKNNFRA